MPPKPEAKPRQSAAQEAGQASLERDVVEKELIINGLRQKLDRSAREPSMPQTPFLGVLCINHSMLACRMKELGERLIEDNSILHGQVDAQQGSLKEINEYLQNELTGQLQINAALEKRVAELQSQVEESRSARQVMLASSIMGSCMVKIFLHNLRLEVASFSAQRVQLIDRLSDRFEVCSGPGTDLSD